jgi:hypothetical protein
MTEAGGRSDLGAFVEELRAVNPKLAEDLARALAAYDIEADGSAGAAAVIELLNIAARSHDPVEKKVRAMVEVLKLEGRVTVPSSLLHPKPTNREG